MVITTLPDISIVIPIYNEVRELDKRKHYFFSLQKSVKEVIFVDGGSSDGSRQVLIDLGMKVIQASLGRASQMNAGANAALGSTLLFLHVDTLLPALTHEQYCGLANNKWGFFLVQLDNPSWPYRLIATGINFRSKVKRVGTGDQALFVNRKLFHSLGGFPEIALMEDISLARMLRKHGSPKIVKKPVITAARRWEHGGLVRVMLLMWSLQLLFAMGVSPSRLARWYGYNN